jgi:hypothetical protein
MDPLEILEMPRQTPEELAGELYRTRHQRHPQPPAYFSGEQKALWKEIVADRLSNWFRPGGLQLLEQFVVATTEYRRVVSLLGEAETGSPEHTRLQRQMSRCTATAISLASALRIAPQQDVHRHQTARTAAQGEGEEDALLSGAGENIVDIKPHKRAKRA